MQIALLDVLMNSWHVSNTNLLLYIHSFYSEQNKFFSCQILTSCSLNQKRTNNIFHHWSLFLNLLPSPKTFLDFPSTSVIIESNTSRDGASTTPLGSLFQCLNCVCNSLPFIFSQRIVFLSLKQWVTSTFHIFAFRHLFFSSLWLTLDRILLYFISVMLHKNKWHCRNTICKETQICPFQLSVVKFLKSIKRVFFKCSEYLYQNVNEW